MTALFLCNSRAKYVKLEKKRKFKRMRAKDKETNLTQQQTKFCNLYVYGGKNTDDEDCLGNASASYKGAYSTKKMKAQTINNESSKLLNNHYVTAMIQALSDEKAHQNKSQGMVESERLKNKLWNVADDNTERTSDRIKAMELLGRSIGLFKDHSITESVISIDQAHDDLNKALADALNDDSVVELFPRDNE